MVQLRKKSDDSLKMFGEMTKSLKNIEIVKTNAPNKETTTTDNSIKIAEIPRRKRIMFPSSIALETDPKRYEQEVNCDLI